MAREDEIDAHPPQEGRGRSWPDDEVQFDQTGAASVQVEIGG
jgi:hypothetical protein